MSERDYETLWCEFREWLEKRTTRVLDAYGISDEDYRDLWMYPEANAIKYIRDKMRKMERGEK